MHYVLLLLRQTIANAKLIKAMWTIHQYVAYTVCTPLQEAVAVSFEQAAKNDYFESYRKSLEEKRDRLAEMVREAGLDPIIPQGSYFMMVDTSAISLPEEDQDAGRPRDFAVAKYLTRHAGVLGIPPSAFYSAPNKPLADNLLRLCFCKTGRYTHLPQRVGMFSCA
jgi:kynurenine---oxoglutarate transaminase / cysteine-S-conjugate beta-lyase / glutamine---phenylpyruvate transaminase